MESDTSSATVEKPSGLISKGITHENAAEYARRATQVRIANKQAREAGPSSYLRGRLVDRLATVVKDGDIDTLIRAAPTIRMLTEDADNDSDAPDPLAARYRALGYEPPY